MELLFWGWRLSLAWLRAWREWPEAIVGMVPVWAGTLVGLWLVWSCVLTVYEIGRKILSTKKAMA